MKKAVLFVLSVLLVLSAGFVALKAYRSLQWDHSVLHEKINVLESSLNSVNYRIENSHVQKEHYDFEYPWIADHSPVLIAHAMGGIDGHAYTNSKEAMELAYENGIRLFEADFQLLDGRIVMLHDIERGAQMCSFDSNEFDEKQFLSSRLYGEYTPMSWRMVLEFMREHPDAYIVTDTKYDKQPYMSNVLSSLVIEALEYDESLLDRVIVQIYNQPMLDAAMDIYPFSSVIYTLYMSQDSMEQVKAFCAKSGIKAVTMPEGAYPESFVSALSSMGISSFAHTVNDEEKLQSLLGSGYSGIYTDFLVPSGK